jgi:hypothetical protein
MVTLSFNRIIECIVSPGFGRGALLRRSAVAVGLCRSVRAAGGRPAAGDGSGIRTDASADAGEFRPKVHPPNRNAQNYLTASFASHECGS